MVNIKRFSLKPTDEINFNSHTQLVEIHLGAETSAVGTVYNNGAQIIKNNSTLKQGIFSYKQNKKIVDTIYDNVTVINTGGSYSKTYFKLKNSGSTTFEIVDENGIKVDFLNSVETRLEGGVFEIKPVANIKAKTINLSEPRGIDNIDGNYILNENFEAVTLYRGDVEYNCFEILNGVTAYSLFFNNL